MYFLLFSFRCWKPVCAFQYVHNRFEKIGGCCSQMHKNVVCAGRTCAPQNHNCFATTSGHILPVRHLLLTLTHTQAHTRTAFVSPSHTFPDPLSPFCPIFLPFIHLFVWLRGGEGSRKCEAGWDYHIVPVLLSLNRGNVTEGGRKYLHGSVCVYEENRMLRDKGPLSAPRLHKHAHADTMIEHVNTCTIAHHTQTCFTLTQLFSLRLFCSILNKTFCSLTLSDADVSYVLGQRFHQVLF